MTLGLHCPFYSKFSYVGVDQKVDHWGNHQNGWSFSLNGNSRPWSLGGILIGQSDSVLGFKEVSSRYWHAHRWALGLFGLFPWAIEWAWGCSAGTCQGQPEKGTDDGGRHACNCLEMAKARHLRPLYFFCPVRSRAYWHYLFCFIESTHSWPTNVRGNVLQQMTLACGRKKVMGRKGEQRKRRNRKKIKTDRMKT